MQYHFTDRVRKVLALAKEEAAKLNHDYVSPEHVLLGMIRENEGVGVTVLEHLNVNLQSLAAEIRDLVRPGTATVTKIGEIPYTGRTKKMLEFAMAEARELQHDHVGTEHLLLGLVREEKSPAGQVLRTTGVTLDKAREVAIKLMGGQSGQGDAVGASATSSAPSAAHAGASGPASGATATKSKTPALDHFTRDLTALAREGKLEPIIGRDKETSRVVEILCRKKKNNPVLTGEPGVGKTAIVEGLALRIADGSVAEPLQNTRVLMLDLAAVIAGTKYRGQFEERLKSIMNEIDQSKNIILFLDELHTMIGAGGAEGAMDASNMLKPALARGELRVIGATTDDEYRKHIEKDGALERRFQRVAVEAATVEQTIEILKGLRSDYERHHNVRYSEAAVEAAVNLSERYIADRQLPDKAIDVIDEAGAHVRLENSAEPLDVQKYRAELESLGAEKDKAIAAQDFERAAQLRDEERQAKEAMEERIKVWQEERFQNRPEVTVENVAFVVSRWAGVNASDVTTEEADKLLRMEEVIGSQVIGQPEAVEVVSQAIRRNRAGLRDPRRPIGSFLFAGPTGVGKTEMARSLARFLFGDRDALIRIDMSEYMEKFSVSRLIGAPPGYVGYSDSGQLTKAVRKRPYSVVLLDEIEKAHPDVFNILLQILDDGQVTDSQGRKVSFKNTVIIMTSNLGASDISKGGKKLGFMSGMDGGREVAIRERVSEKLEGAFAPEFLNRIDDTVVFRPLGRAEIAEIVHLMLADLVSRLNEHGHDFVITDRAIELIVEGGMDEKFGARPLRRSIQRLVENPLSDMMLGKQFSEGQTIVVDVTSEGDALAFSGRDVAEPNGASAAQAGVTE